MELRNPTGVYIGTPALDGNTFYQLTGATGIGAASYGTMSFDASNVVPTSPENRPVNASETIILRAFN